MIRSMTGFGKAERLAPNKKFSVEIRSLNSKQLDLSIKMPSAYRSLEPEIRTLATKALQRGKVEIFVTAESTAVETSAHINKEQFRAYVRQLSDALTYAGMEASFDAMMQSVLRMPDVVSTPNETVPEEEHAALLAAAGEAVARLDDFRLQEGATLIADLLRRVDKIEGYKEEVVPYEKARTETIKARIRENLAQLDVEVDSNRLEQEMIFYLEKLDITEEKVRLPLFPRSGCRRGDARAQTRFHRSGDGARNQYDGLEGQREQHPDSRGKDEGRARKNQRASTQYFITVNPKQSLISGLMGKLIIFSAPSGSGKTTIVRELLRRIPQLEFSISATSRAPRGTERDGVDYYFLSPDEFRRAVDEERFVEWEEVYAGTCYGTLRSELDRIWGKGHTILFDVDVLGGINLKRIFGADACSVFIMPPSIEELERRLELRGTDAPEVIAKRVAKAEFELTKAPEFDHVVVNDVLDTAVAEVERIVRDFLS